jgi:transcriptional regulator with XRE-family HTH domain
MKKRSFMLTQAESHELVVWTGKSELEEAKSVFSRFNAAFQTVPQTAPHRDLKSDVVVFYLHHPTEDTVIESALFELKSYKPASVVFYFPHHSSDFAFRIGKLVERSRFRETEWAFNMQHLRQLLRAKKVQFPVDETLDDGGKELVKLRKRLGLIQDEMAEALGVTPRTLQNWEKGVGTSQLKRKIRDLVELTSLMDDYVSAPRETEWLSTPLAALQHKTPKELIASGRARDLIVEFLRLREGQPA